jgi:AcrR family transcriptional regulator
MDPLALEALFGAILDELADKGYAAWSLTAVAGAVGLRKAEVEAEFADKDACLFAAHERVSSELVERARGGCEDGYEWPQRVHRGLCAVLEMLAARPRIAVALTQSFPAIGPAAYRRYCELIEAFVPLLREGREFSGAEAELPSEVELLAAGAAEALIFGAVEAGRTEELPEMGPEILFSVLVPFIGPQRAAEEMHEAAGAQ